MAKLPTIEVPFGSREYVKAALEADEDLDDQIPEMRILPNAWFSASWEGVAGTTRTVRSTQPVDFANFSRSLPHKVYVRFPDTPEIPIIEVGTILVTA